MPAGLIAFFSPGRGCMGRRKRIVIAVVAALPVLIGVIAWLVETDQEAIERMTDECRRDLLRGDVEAVTSRLAEEAEGDGYIGTGPLAPRVRYWADQTKERLRDLSLSLRKIVVEGDGARAEWAVRADLKGVHGYHGQVRFLVRLEYRRGPNGWLITRANAVDWSL